jgi:hypothetical protein
MPLSYVGQTCRRGHRSHSLPTLTKQPCIRTTTFPLSPSDPNPQHQSIRPTSTTTTKHALTAVLMSSSVYPPARMAKATFSALAGLAEAGLKLAPQKLDLSVTACLRPIPMAAMASVQASSVLFDATTDQTRHR